MAEADGADTEINPKHEIRMSKQRPNTARHESGKFRFPDFGFRISNFEYSSRSGQALIETVIALVALLAVFAALVQLSRLGRARTVALMEAREEAGRNALSAAYAQPTPTPTFIYDWEKGGDNRSHSADDVSRAALSQTVATGLLAPAHPHDLADRLPGNALSGLQGLDPVVAGFDFVHGRVQSERIELLPVVRRLLYDEEDIRITSDAWLTWAREVP